MFKRSWVFIASFGLSFAWSSGSYSQIVDPIDHPQERQEQPAEQPTIEPPSVSHIAPAEMAGPEHNNSAAPNSGAHAQEESNLIWGDGWAQWLMAITGIFAIALSGWAVWLLKQTLVATRLTLTEAENATDLAQRTLEETARIGQSQTRAYIGIEKEEVTQKPPIEIAFVFKNYGQSLAFDVTITMAWSSLPPAPDFFDRVEHKFQERSGSMHPGQTMRLTIDTVEDKGSIDAHVVTAEQILNGEAKMFVFGFVKYKDIFGASRTTNLSRYIESSNGRLTMIYSSESNDSS